MPRKDEREPTIKYCLGVKVDVVQVHHNTELWPKLMLGQWNSSGIFPKSHYNAALQQSPRGARIIFMSMFNDISTNTNHKENGTESQS